jgi:hypothetical protein
VRSAAAAQTSRHHTSCRYGLYKRCQSGDNKTRVTVALQETVVREFMAEGISGRYFDSVSSGLSFLRGAVGNFPSHLPQLTRAANYVRFTQKCVRGSLRQGHELDGSSIPLVDPSTGESSTLASFVSNEPLRPLVVISSSYS